MACALLLYFFIEALRFRRWVHEFRADGGVSFAADAVGEDLSAFLSDMRELKVVHPVFESNPAEILYSAAEEERYRIRRLDRRTNGEVVEEGHAERDSFYPLSANGSIYSLSDRHGDQNYEFTQLPVTELNSVPAKSRAFSLSQGDRILFTAKPDFNREVAYLTTRVGRHVSVAGDLPLEGRYMCHSLSSDGRFLLIGSSGGLWCWDLSAGTSVPLAQSIPGEKGGPAWDESRNAIFFSAVAHSGFREIFRLPYRREEDTLQFAEKPSLFFASHHDKNQLQVHEDHVYFVEDDDTRYLLKRIALASGRVQTLTHLGVVYRYHVPEGGDEIIATYADPATPLALVGIHRSNGRIRFLSSMPEANRRTFISQETTGWRDMERPAPDLSPAWIFRPRAVSRGVILSIHGGPDINVSPRWDPAIELWLRLGLTVVAPNYPGSRGFGKEYLEAPVAEALNDLAAWATRIRADFPGQPFLVEGMSYGGRLAQEFLRAEPFPLDGLILRSTHLLLPHTSPRTLPPTLVQFGRHDSLVPAGQVLRDLFEWSTIAPDRVFFQELADEGHLVRSGRSRASSLAAMAVFIRRVLGDERRQSER